MSDASSNILVLTTLIVQERVKEQLTEDTTVEEIARMAFKALEDPNCNFLVTDDEAKFRIGTCVVKLLAKPEDQPRVEAELNRIRALSAMFSSGRLCAFVDELQNNEEKPIGLLKIFKEEAGI